MSSSSLGAGRSWPPRANTQKDGVGRRRFVADGNRTAGHIAHIIAASEHLAAKWLKDSATGGVWFWPAEQSTHADMSKALGVTDYTKGIATSA